MKRTTDTPNKQATPRSHRYKAPTITPPKQAPAPPCRGLSMERGYYRPPGLR